MLQSGEANGYWLRDSDHAVENMNGDGDLTALSVVRARTQRRANDMLVASDRGLNEAAAAVTGRFLPRHAALLRDELDVTVSNRLAVSLGRDD